MQLFFLGQGEKLVVGHGVPKEVRHAASELIVVNGVRVGAVGPLIQFDAEEELGGAEHGLEPPLQTRLPIAGVLFALLGQPDEPLDFVGGGRSAIGAGGEAGQDRAGVGYFVAFRVGPRQELQPGRGNFRLHGTAGESPPDNGFGKVDGEGPRHDRVRGGEIALHQQGRDGEDVADVVEAVTDVVLGKLAGVEVHADQIANGVAILDAIEPAHRHLAGIAFGGACRPG